MAYTIKIVFGEHAARLHSDGEPDAIVLDEGSIETFTFDTEAELNAFKLGLESMDGWMGYCKYDPDNLRGPECEECGEEFPDAGDGYDGLCPDCADRKIAAEDEENE